MTNRNVTALPRWVLTLIALIPLAGVLAGAARFVKQSADDRYVMQAGYALDRRSDSLNKISETKDMRHYLDSTAKDLKVCIRHPEDCR